MYEYGDEAGAEVLKAHAETAWRSGDAMLEIIKKVNSSSVGGWDARWAKKKEPEGGDILAESFEPPQRGLLQLQIGTDHAATLYGKWLFDANFTTALPLCRASLDAMVARTREGARFSHVARAMRLDSGRGRSTVRMKRVRDAGEA